MVEPQKVVTLIAGLSLLIVGVYDVYAAGWLGPDFTVSRVVLEWSRKWPIMPFLAGLVIGHIFWPQ